MLRRRHRYERVREQPAILREQERRGLHRLLLGNTRDGRRVLCHPGRVRVLRGRVHFDRRLEIFTTEATGSVSAESVSATMSLIDDTTGDSYSASAQATFEPAGSRVTTTRLGDNSRIKVTEQLLTPTGAIEFSTGETFVIDAEHCFALEFKNHAVTTQPAGPKPGGAVPINDTPDGAIAVAAGDRFNVPTGGASLDAEQPIVTCPEGEFDTFGRTLWYTIEGTGDPVTVDTAGSNFDTLIGVYESDGESLHRDRVHRRRLLRSDRRDLPGGADVRHGRRDHLLHPGRRVPRPLRWNDPIRAAAAGDQLDPELGRPSRPPDPSRSPPSFSVA